MIELNKQIIQMTFIIIIIIIYTNIQYYGVNLNSIINIYNIIILWIC